MLDFGLDPAGTEQAGDAARRSASSWSTQRAAGRLVLLVIDEAQNLSLPALEEIRMLSNLETEKSKLHADHPDRPAGPARQARRGPSSSSCGSASPSAITCSRSTPTKPRATSTIGCAARRSARRSSSRATSPTVIHDRSGGVPRMINVIADATLLFGYGEERCGDRRAADRGRHRRSRRRPACSACSRTRSAAPRSSRRSQRPAKCWMAVRGAGSQRRRAPRSRPDGRAARGGARAAAAAPSVGRDQRCARTRRARAPAAASARSRLPSRERESAEQRRVLAEQHRMLKPRSRPAPPPAPADLQAPARGRRSSSPSAGPAAGRRTWPPRARSARARPIAMSCSAERRRSFWRRLSDTLFGIRTGAGGFAVSHSRSSSRRASRAHRASAPPRVGVVGLGYVGLPLAVEFARAGFDTTGIDLDAAQGRRDQRRARPYIPDVPTAEVRAARRRGPSARDDRLLGRRRARHDQHLRADAAAEDEGPGHVLHRVGGRSRSPSTCTRGMLVILESTTYPGTTEELVQPMLEAQRAAGRRRLLPGVLAGARRSGQPDVQHAQRPEGRRRRRRRLRPSWRPRSTARRSRRIVPVSSPQVAEMVKLLENTFRAVNIGLVNEIALMCDRARHRRLGGGRRGGDQAVRLHAVLPRARPRRPLHPDRPVLPVVEGEAERLRPAVHRAGRPGQRRRCRTSSSTRSPTR